MGIIVVLQVVLELDTRIDFDMQVDIQIIEVMLVTEVMEVDGRQLHSLEIFIHYTCNYKCDFCFENDVFIKKFLKPEDICEIILRSKEKGVNHLVFS